MLRLRGIAAKLIDERHEASRRGKEWTATAVKRILNYGVAEMTPLEKTRADQS
jgi:hypothetical protein